MTNVCHKKTKSYNTNSVKVIHSISISTHFFFPPTQFCLQRRTENISLQTAHLLSFILVQVVLFLLISQVPPHPSDNLSNLPQLQVRVGCLHLVPYLACAHNARHKHTCKGRGITPHTYTKRTYGYHRATVVSSKLDYYKRVWGKKEEKCKGKISSYWTVLVTGIMVVHLWWLTTLQHEKTGKKTNTSTYT